MRIHAGRPTLRLGRHVALALFALLPPACGGSTLAPGGGSADGGSSADAAPSPSSPASGAQIGTYIALGDSISDQGGEPPFFYDLLLKNDDATYPDWKGRDLTTKYPGIKYVHAAVGGAVAGNYSDGAGLGRSLLVDQIKGLDHTYPGDVFVTITIGGNDLASHATSAITGGDATYKTEFAANMKAALGELTSPGRLGSGKLFIVEANIYDATDGQGDWTKGGPACPPFDVGKQADVAVFDAWNGIITKAETDVGDIALDLRALFAGHGFNGPDNWFFPDCIHPNKKGHAALRAEVWRLFVGN